MATSKKTVSIGAVLAVLLLTACTNGPAATVAPLETQVLLAAGDGDAREVAEEANAAQGDVVSTDGDGLAELVFPDGSFMRLGPDSEVEVTELGSAEVQRTSIALDIGETWHNVVELVAEDAVYEVVTPVGVASVRGTVFAVICVEGPSCEFIVFDGEIEVDGITLTPYQRVILPDQPEPVIIPVDALPDWATENIERDGEREGAEALPDPPLEAASIAGEWALTLVTTDTNLLSSSVGESTSGKWILGTAQCDPACVVSVESESGWTVDGELTDGTLTFVRTGNFECVYTETGELSGETGTSTLEYAINISQGGPGNEQAAQLTGTLRGEDILDPQFSECDMQTVDGGKTSWTERDITLVPGS